MSFCFWTIGVLFILWMLNPYSVYESQIISPIVWLSFYFLTNGFDTQKFLIFIKVNPLFLSFKRKAHAFGVLSRIPLTNSRLWQLWLWTRRGGFVVITSTLAFLSTYTESKDQPEGKRRALLEFFLCMFPVLSICVAL